MELQRGVVVELPSQTMFHLLSCPLNPKTCSQSDFCAALNDAEVAKF